MKTKNINLLEKVSRKPRADSSSYREHRRVLGPSIDDRPKRNRYKRKLWTLGNRYIDWCENKRRPCFEIMFKIEQKSHQFVDDALSKLYERLGNQANTLFKTITSDNGSEFAGIYEALKDITDVYFADPYASYERGTKENQHKLIRRLIPKGKDLSNLSVNTLNQIQQ